jgi:hypothetical protein
MRERADRSGRADRSDGYRRDPQGQAALPEDALDAPLADPAVVDELDEEDEPEVAGVPEVEVPLAAAVPVELEPASDEVEDLSVPFDEDDPAPTLSDALPLLRESLR